jgi:crotonobetainyl-CoA:carnitine CoA-transferase CaiB-like acyl-CoA transferase
VNNIFHDLKVIELAGVLAGPSAGYFFAELGANVIKIENPKTSGDVTRTWKLRSEDARDPASAYYWSVNAFKESMLLDLTNSTDLLQLYELLKNADVLISNYKAGDDVKLKVDYASVRNLNPKIIYAAITGFGAGSPRTAYDLILQAESGFMSMNGEPGNPPVKMPVALIDLLAGHQLKEAILIGLLSRYKTGKGCHVTVSLFDSAIASLVNQATNWLIAHHLPKPTGSLHPNIAPYGELFDTSDHHLLTFAIGSNRQFRALCGIINYKSLANDPKYANNHLRVKNRIELYALLYDYIKKFNFNELYLKCLDHNVPVGKIRNLKDVFELPEARDMIRKFSSGKRDLETISGIAFKFIEN